MAGTDTPANSRSLFRYALSLAARSGEPSGRKARSKSAASFNPVPLNPVPLNPVSDNPVSANPWSANVVALNSPASDGCMVLDFSGVWRRCTASDALPGAMDPATHRTAPRRGVRWIRQPIAPRPAQECDGYGVSSGKSGVDSGIHRSV